MVLQRREVDPPESEPMWGERELETRYALWRQNVEKEGAVIFCAFLGDDLVGISMVTMHRENQTCEVYALHVDRDHRRQGIGTALLLKAEAQCRDWRSSQLLLYTGFKASSLDFYRAQGYRVVGIQDPQVKTKNFDLTMVKELD